MIREKIVKLHDEDLAKVSGGENKFMEGLTSEAGKQTLLFIAAPIVVGTATAVSVFAKWVCDKITKKYDKKLEEALGITQQ